MRVSIKINMNITDIYFVLNRYVICFIQTHLQTLIHMHARATHTHTPLSYISQSSAYTYTQIANSLSQTHTYTHRPIHTSKHLYFQALFQKRVTIAISMLCTLISSFTHKHIYCTYFSRYLYACTLADILHSADTLTNAFGVYTFRLTRCQRVADTLHAHNAAQRSSYRAARVNLTPKSISVQR